MKKGKGCLLALVGIPLLLVVAYMLAYPSHSWNQKLTVTVETPDGAVSGSSVVWVQWRDSPKILPDPPTVSSRVQGEAVVVTLPNGRMLFGLISNAATIALRTFAKTRVSDSTDQRIVPASEVNDHHGETKEVSGLNYPLLVTFSDINDPASVKKVDPNNLAASFGAGYSLKSITLEITDEKVTKGVVEGVLGRVWTHAGYLGGTKRLDHSRPELNMTIGDFMKGIKK